MLYLVAAYWPFMIGVLVVGRSMSFWTDHMPRGMFLRSGPDWHLDTAGVRTMEAFLAERGTTAKDAMPIPRESRMVSIMSAVSRLISGRVGSSMAAARPSRTGCPRRAILRSVMATDVGWAASRGKWPRHRVFPTLVFGAI